MTAGAAHQSQELERIAAMLAERHYIADDQIVMAVYLAEALQKPLLVEGPAGVGKTEIAKVMAGALDADLIRLQCYEGLDAHTALYEWDYQRQLLHIRLDEHSERPLEEREREIFSEHFLLKRPLLQAITHERPAVLLVDELDRADEEFESFLLEVFSDWQITVPELGTLVATQHPYVVITSNRYRELSDAIRRRCFYLWIDYPEFPKELEIVRSRIPAVDSQLAQQICRFVERLRQEQLEKVPGIAETLDWTRTLVLLHADHLQPELVARTLGTVLKSRRDLEQVRGALGALLEAVGVQPRLAGGSAAGSL